MHLGIFESLFVFFQNIIEALGYTGVCILMALESMVAPVPSEGVMPFAGFLVATGDFTLFGAILASSIGSMIGSWLSYAMGYYGGRPFVLKIGKYLLLNVHHLEWAEKFFTKYGGGTIFVSRFIPVVRHLISIPAGAGKMNLIKFSIYTLIGATMWNTFLIWCGIKLKENWEKVHHFSSYLDIVVILCIVGFIGYMIYKKFKGPNPNDKINSKSKY